MNAATQQTEFKHEMENNCTLTHGIPHEYQNKCGVFEEILLKNAVKTNSSVKSKLARKIANESIDLEFLLRIHLCLRMCSIWLRMSILKLKRSDRFVAAIRA